MIFIIFIIFIINMSLVPESFLCPITRNIMNNPYIDNDGNTYEYSAIFEWLLNKIIHLLLLEII